MDFHSFLSLFCNARLRCINCKQHLTGDIAQIMENERTQFDVAHVEVVGRSDETIEMIVAIRAQAQLLDHVEVVRRSNEAIEMLMMLRAQAQLFDDILAGHATELSTELIAQMIYLLEVMEHHRAVYIQEAQNNAFLNNARITQELAQWHAW